MCSRPTRRPAPVAKRGPRGLMNPIRNNGSRDRRASRESMARRGLPGLAPTTTMWLCRGSDHDDVTLSWLSSRPAWWVSDDRDRCDGPETPNSVHLRKSDLRGGSGFCASRAAPYLRCARQRQAPATRTRHPRRMWTPRRPGRRATGAGRELGRRETGAGGSAPAPGAGPGPSQRQPVGTMLRPTSRRTGFRVPGGAGVHSGSGGLGSRCPERRPE